MTNEEIQNLIDEMQSNLNTLNNVLVPHGRMSATALEGLMDSMNNGYKDLLTALNNNKVNLGDLPIPMPSENLFSTAHMALGQDVEHDLAHHLFSFSSSNELNDYKMLWKVLKNTFSFVSTNFANTLESRTELALNPGRITLRASQEVYYNGSTNHSPMTGVSLKNPAYSQLWQQRITPNRVYILDCFVTGLHNPELVYSGRLKAMIVRDPATGNAVFIPSTYIVEQGVFDPHLESPIMNAEINLTGDKITIQARNNKDDIPTLWKYEIKLRIL